MSRLALTGGAYQARSLIASAQRCLNLYSEPLPQQQGEPSQYAHYPTPGLRLLGTLPQGPVRGIKQTTTGGIYAVGGNGVYLLDPTTFTATLLGTITALRPYPVSMQDNGLDLFIVDGTAGGWTVDLTSNSFTLNTDPSFAGADAVHYLDTYFIFNKPQTPQFYISLSLSTAFDSLDFANKESFSDLLVTLAVARREIWLLGERTTEIWFNAGVTSTADFTFQEVQGVFVDHGCAAKYSVAVYDNSIFWLSYDRNGIGFVLQGAGYQTKRVSTFPIETAIMRYPRIDDAIGFVYALGGHVCYVLTFPTADHTWVYNVTTGQWHEWLWLDVNGREHRHRANCAYPCDGTIVIGDWQNGNLYALDADAFTDNGAPIKRQRSFPHLINDARRMFYSQFIADVETGNAPTVEPVVIVQNIPTWPPQLAQLVGPPLNLGTRVATDWARGLVYFMDGSVYDKYALGLTTQPAPIATAATDGLYPQILAVDPLSGDLLTQRGTTNAEPIVKRDPTTFAAIGSFGAATSFPSYPTSVWIGQSIVCIVCNGVSYGLLKYSEFSGTVSAFRVDTMQQAGFSQNVVSGSIDNRGTMCAGASGGTTATAFLSWDSTTYPEPTIPLYVITITAGAESYNPASWPATNPHITAATVGTVAAAEVDPTQPGIMVYSLGYDLADGNVLMSLGTGPMGGTPVNYWIVKLRASDAAVLWTVPVSNQVHVSFERSRINGSLWVFDPNASWQIDTITGAATTQRFRGVAVGSLSASLDSETQLAFYQGSYSGGVTDSPAPIPGSGNFSNGWAVMGGQITNTIVRGGVDLNNRIWLDWSDDRGHSYGNPVCQTFGHRGRYIASLQWQRLGYARDRVFRLTWSEALDTALQGAWIDVNASAKS